MFEQPALLEGPLADMGGRMREREKLAALITPWLARQPKRERFHRGQKAGLAWSYLASLSEELVEPQLDARAFFVEVDEPQLGAVRMPGAPFRGSTLRGRAASAPS